jgi:hypothetical protein
MVLGISMVLGIEAVFGGLFGALVLDEAAR